jgi:hypothetical protein
MDGASVNRGGEIQALGRLLATMQERSARGDVRAQRIVTVLEEMIAEREERFGDGEGDSPSSEGRDRAARQ